jgi:hypothetical protein
MKRAIVSYLIGLFVFAIVGSLIALLVINGYGFHFVIGLFILMGLIAATPLAWACGEGILKLWSHYQDRKLRP